MVSTVMAPLTGPRSGHINRPLFRLHGSSEIRRRDGIYLFAAKIVKRIDTQSGARETHRAQCPSVCSDRSLVERPNLYLSLYSSFNLQKLE